MGETDRQTDKEKDRERERDRQREREKYHKRQGGKKSVSRAGGKERRQYSQAH